MYSLMRVLVRTHTCMHAHAQTHTHTQHACIYTHKYHLHPQPTHVQYRCFLGIQNLPVMKCECLIIVTTHSYTIQVFPWHSEFTCDEVWVFDYCYNPLIYNTGVSLAFRIYLWWSVSVWLLLQPTHIQYRCFLGIQNLPVMKCECLIIVTTHSYTIQVFPWHSEFTCDEVWVFDYCSQIDGASGTDWEWWTAAGDGAESAWTQVFCWEARVTVRKMCIPCKSVIKWYFFPLV